MKFRPHNEYFEFSINTWLIDLKINMRYIPNILSQKLLTIPPPKKNIQKTTCFNINFAVTQRDCKGNFK